MTNQLALIKKKIRPILKKHAVVKAGIFGSYAQGKQKKKSDVDILIQFKGRKSLFDLIGLEQELEQVLDKKCDVVTYKSLNPLIKQRILKEEVKVL